MGNNTLQLSTVNFKHTQHWFCPDCMIFATTKISRLPKVSLTFEDHELEKDNKGAEVKSIYANILCPKCGWFMTDVDRKMIPYIKAFNSIGLTTMFCCEGHWSRDVIQENSRSVSEIDLAYLSFLVPEYIPSIQMPGKDFFKRVAAVCKKSYCEWEVVGKVKLSEDDDGKEEWAHEVIIRQCMEPEGKLPSWFDRYISQQINITKQDKFKHSQEYFFKCLKRVLDMYNILVDKAEATSQSSV